MKYLEKILLENQDWLVKRVIEHATEHGYAKYASAMRADWRLSISKLTESIITMIYQSEEIPGISVDIDYSKSELTQFGIKEARLHRKRGVPIDMFLGMIKYYRQSFVDLVNEELADEKNPGTARSYVERSFDQIEIAFCKEWINLTDSDHVKELQKTNRIMVNEKNTFLSIFENISDPIISLNEHNEILNLNMAAYRLIPKENMPSNTEEYFSKSANIHKFKEDFIVGREASVFFPWCKEVFQKYNEEKSDAQEIRLNINGKEKCYHVTFSHAMDVSEKITNSIITMRDITAIKTVEKILKEMNAGKDKFLSIIAHDLKSPLSVLLGYSQILVEDYKDLPEDEKYNFASSIYQISNGLSLLLKNLLEWAMAHTGTINYTPDKFNINELLDHPLFLLRENAKKKEIEIINEIPDELNVFADKYMIETVVRNLVSNAIKFSPHKGEIKLSGIHNEEKAAISVEDHGVGIPPDVLKNLFSLEKTKSTKGTDNEEGTGLGLLLCKEFIEKNGGEIEAESEAGQGSKFTFTIPLQKETAHA